MPEAMTLWPAKSHTLAKIEILRAYQGAWCAIFAQSQHAQGQDLLYVDGFAGPGRYSNGHEGSPIVAMKTFIGLSNQLKSKGQWRAGKLRCVFIETNKDSAEYLRGLLTTMCKNDGDVIWQVEHGTFATVFPKLEGELPSVYAAGSPILLFLDPFGAKGVPFSLIESVLSRPRCELLLNFDHDGYARISRAGASANAQQPLTLGLGGAAWQSTLIRKSFSEQCDAVLKFYKQNLLSIPRVDFVTSFQMQTPKKSFSSVGYSLVFASQSPRGLEKMKGAMKVIAQDGHFQFSNAYRGQLTLFRFDDPAFHAELLYEAFAGKQASLSELNQFALIETPFTNAKAMLKYLDIANRITVNSTDPKRRKGTFSNSTTSITFNARGPL